MMVKTTRRVSKLTTCTEFAFLNTIYLSASPKDIQIRSMRITTDIAITHDTRTQYDN